MKKLILMAVIVMMTYSCDKKVKESQPPTSPNVIGAETAPPPVVKNEMVAEMDEMMADMHEIKFTGNTDRDFAEMMEDHHEGAIDMSEILLKKGTDPELKDFARKLIFDQNKEIDLLDQFDHFKEVSPDHVAFQKDLQASMAAMMDKNITIYHDIDKDYAQQMIPHHQSAVDMAKVYLKYGKDSQLLSLCENIISSQTKEISFLQDWLSRH